MAQQFVERILTGASLPPGLRDLPKPPVQVYVRGDLPRGPSVAIVGTRRASPEALLFARRLSSELATAGVTVLSGGASGIDTAAHWGALDARGLTVVVAPCGFERPFPAKNETLFQQIVRSGGAYISLVPAQQPAHPSAFFPRNGCLAALARAVVLVESPLRSGARNTTAQARLIGRPVLVVPAAPWQSCGAGCIAELKLGARPVATSADVIAAVQRTGATLVSACTEQSMSLTLASALPEGLWSSEGENPGEDALRSRASRVLGAVASGARRIDDICTKTGLVASEVTQSLSILELEGRLYRDGSGTIRPAGAKKMP